MPTWLTDALSHAKRSVLHPDHIMAREAIFGEVLGRQVLPSTEPAIESVTQSQELNMFKSIGHFFATFIQKVVVVLPKVEATEKTVETVTAAIPGYGPLALTAEKLAYAALGELSAVLTAGESAASAKLADAGLDINVIKSVQALIAEYPQVVALAKAAVTK
jgi:hypothetical protein